MQSGSRADPTIHASHACEVDGLFSVNMKTDEGIPLNKRGSGVRRLVLVSFFKAEAGRRLRTSNKRSIIYAIEEPETSQHPNNQFLMIESFKSLADEVGCQILLSTAQPRIRIGTACGGHSLHLPRTRGHARH